MQQKFHAVDVIIFVLQRRIQRVTHRLKKCREFELKKYPAKIFLKDKSLQQTKFILWLEYARWLNRAWLFTIIQILSCHKLMLDLKEGKGSPRVWSLIENNVNSFCDLGHIASLSGPPISTSVKQGHQNKWSVTFWWSILQMGNWRCWELQVRWEVQCSATL